MTEDDAAEPDVQNAEDSASSTPEPSKAPTPDTPATLAMRGLPKLQEATTVGVFGPVASGKTHLLKLWARTMPRVVIFDTSYDYDEEEWEHVWANPKALAERLGAADQRGEDFRIVYHSTNLEEGFSWAVDAIWQIERPRWFIVEEVHEFMSPQYQHEKMNLLSRYARKRLLGFIGASQRIADVNKNFCSACRMSVLFHSAESTDIGAIRDRYGSECADAVSGLRGLAYDDVSGTTQQTPQAVVHRRGLGWEVIEVG